MDRFHECLASLCSSCIDHFGAEAYLGFPRSLPRECSVHGRREQSGCPRAELGPPSCPPVGALTPGATRTCWPRVSVGLHGRLAWLTGCLCRPESRGWESHLRVPTSPFRAASRRPPAWGRGERLRPHRQAIPTVPAGAPTGATRVANTPSSPIKPEPIKPAGGSRTRGRSLLIPARLLRRLVRSGGTGPCPHPCLPDRGLRKSLAFFV